MQNKTNILKELNMKKALSAIALIIVCAAMTSCESWKRSIKSMQSDFGGGLHRTVTLLDYQGDTLKQWTGKFDVRDEGVDNQVYFDIDGKRVWIQGGIVVNEEL